LGLPTGVLEKWFSINPVSISLPVIPKAYMVNTIDLCIFDDEQNMATKCSHSGVIGIRYSVFLSIGRNIK